MKNPVRNTLLFITGSIAVAALCLGTSSTAGAAGLGEPLLLSELGQPLNAEIESVALRAGDEDLAARPAPSQDFYRAGAEIDPALSGIEFTILRHGDRSVLRLSTRQSANGAYLELRRHLHDKPAQGTDGMPDRTVRGHTSPGSAFRLAHEFKTLTPARKA